MNKVVTLVVFCINITLCNSQNVFFDQHYELGTWSRGYSVISSANSTYIVAGSNDSLVNGFGRYSGVVFKTDSLGDTLVTHQFITTDTLYFQTYNLNSDDIFYWLCQTPDSNLLVLGSTQSLGASNLYDFDIYLVKLTYNLDTIWTKVISHPNDTVFNPNQVINTSDGGFLIAGWQYSFISSDVRAFLCKIDSSGNLLWRTSYSNLYKTSTFWSVVETPDHGFICSGSLFDVSYEGHASLFKVDSVGNFMQTMYSDPQSDTYGSRIIPTSDGNFMWATMRSFGTNFRNQFTKLDATGTFIWDKQYCVYQEGGPMAILQNPDGTFMMAGGNGVPNQSGLSQGILMKMDTNGDSLWSRLYHMPSQYGWFYDIDLCIDGGYILCGETYCCNFTPGVGNTSSLWLVRTDSLGLFTGFNDLVDMEQVTIMGLPYPNPASSYCELNLTIPDANLPGRGRKGIELLLFDQAGKQISSQSLTRATNKARIEMSEFASGTYLVVLSIDGYNAGSRRIVKY